MITDAHMTVEQFIQARPGLPEGGRWHELHAGIPALMEAPDDMHGNIVLNLSRGLAEWFGNRTEQTVGYACHEVGLHVESSPDTVYVPAISYFDAGSQFEQTDLVVATRVPRLVIEVASANDRRRDLRQRTLSYVKHGVEMIWIPDPSKKEVQVIQKGKHTLALGQRQTVEGNVVLPGFRIAVEEIFAQPGWWS
jgi:Uma2 family endonuclease